MDGHPMFWVVDVGSTGIHHDFLLSNLNPVRIEKPDGVYCLGQQRFEKLLFFESEDTMNW